MVDMKQRTISGVILLLVLLGSLVVSSELFAVLMTIVALIGFNEFFEVKFGKDKEKWLVKFLGMLMVLFITFNNIFYEVSMNVLILVPLFCLSLPIIFYNDNKLYNISDALFIIGIIYFVGLSFGNIILMRDISLSRCIFIFIISFVTDTYAYIGGSLIGRHKFTSISPNKTIEGSVVGALMGVVIGSVYYFNIVAGVTVVESVLLCIFLTILSELGDLFFSSIKRNFEIKDYSNLIPGHGGILDRFDSVIYVSLGLSLILSIF